jgi:tRNA1Val (adenine37-N6)-methyltransferase
MANNWFQFKQFRIEQDACAMKVTTDACLFGAWLANLIPASHLPMHTLDIGTGTGLLSLMLAQQHTQVKIDAIELDANAAAQAGKNVALSAFANQIKVHHTDFFDFEPALKYDVVFSNPPFHQQQLKANSSAKNMAHHDARLTIDKLLPKAISVMKQTGLLALLLPYYRMDEMLEAATMHQLSAVEICTVKQSNDHPFFRTMFLFCKTNDLPVKYSSINICDQTPNYSNAFKNLLQPYYLNF